MVRYFNVKPQISNQIERMVTLNKTTQKPHLSKRGFKKQEFSKQRGEGGWRGASSRKEKGVLISLIQKTQYCVVFLKSMI